MAEATSNSTMSPNVEQQSDLPVLPSSLPADDGMYMLRQKMREIHELAISTEEKARKMHLLMTRDYLALNIPTSSPEPRTTEAEEADQTAGPTSDNPYNISPRDLEPTYCPEPIPLCHDEALDDDDDDEHEAGPALGCQHYSRNVKVQCFDCHLWFTCRHCHDASPRLPYPHLLNRQKTQNMLCMMCKTPQPAADVCNTCAHDMAYYYCQKCKLWDNDSTKRIYHCDDCGICRRGEGLGKDYVHCKRCNVCISISTRMTHPCIERATDCDCPLCLEYLFSSQQPVVSLLCGHYMHATCYKDLMTVTYRCPVCNKSAVNMELQWRKLDDEIRIQPMPEEDFEATPVPSRPASASPETTRPQPPDAEPAEPAEYLPSRRRLPRKVWIGCNDCGGRGWSPFHWLGLKCPDCDGYNTTQTNPVGTSVARLPVSQLQRQHDFTGVDAVRSFGDGNEMSGAAGLGPNPGLTVPGEEGHERLSSECACTDASSVEQQTLQRQAGDTHNTPPRSYFFRPEDQQHDSSTTARVLGGYAYNPAGLLLSPDRGAALSASASEMFGGLPYEMVMRLGRSLSPMRYYIDGLDLRSESQPPPRTADILGDEGGQGADGSDVLNAGGKRKQNKRLSDGLWSADGRFLGVFQTSTDEAGFGFNGGIDVDDEEDDEDEDDIDQDEDDEDEEDDSEDEDDYEDEDDEDEDEDWEGTASNAGLARDEKVHAADYLELPGHL